MLNTIIEVVHEKNPKWTAQEIHNYLNKQKIWSTISIIEDILKRITNEN